MLPWHLLVPLFPNLSLWSVLCPGAVSSNLSLNMFSQVVCTRVGSHTGGIIWSLLWLLGLNFHRGEHPILYHTNILAAHWIIIDLEMRDCICKHTMARPHTKIEFKEGFLKQPSNLAYYKVGLVGSQTPISNNSLGSWTITFITISHKWPGLHR